MANFVKQIYKKESALSRKTVFLDRDGTLIKRTNYLSDPSQILLLPGVVKGIKKLNNSNILTIIISNQPVVARGIATIDTVKLNNDSLVKTLNKKNAFINAVYFCPHHPEKHHTDIPSKALKYRVRCQCRKPKLAMFKKAVVDFDINLDKAFMIGDSEVDIISGADLGIPTILVRTKAEEIHPTKADKAVPNFIDAVDIILKQLK